MQKLDPNQVPLIVALAWGNQPSSQADIDKINSTSGWQNQLNLIYGDARCDAWYKTSKAWQTAGGPVPTVVVNGVDYAPV